MNRYAKFQLHPYMASEKKIFECFIFLFCFFVVVFSKI